MLLLPLLIFIGGGDANAKFYLFNRKSPDVKTEITDDNLHLVKANLSVKFMIHGWRVNSENDWYMNMTKAYLHRYDCNVIQVDWGEEADEFYIISSKNTRIIGKNVAEFIVKLNKKLGLGLEKVHLLGHSLGAQVSGVAGREVLRLLGKKIDRISGLDPAGPIFKLKDEKYKLDVGDANFVDVTHTDGGIFGYKDPIGTVDFMPNGGISPQPGCTLFINNKQLSLSKNFSITCSHARSYVYFIESINNDKQIAHKCDSYKKYEKGRCAETEQTIYGEHVDRNATGTFFFRTTPKAPYFT